MFPTAQDRFLTGRFKVVLKILHQRFISLSIINTSKKKTLDEAIRERSSKAGNAKGTSSVDRISLAHAVDTKRVSLVLQQAFAEPISNLRYAIDPSNEGVGVGTTVYRVLGTADLDGEDQDWSLILKQIRKLEGQENERSAFYWSREADYYASELCYSDVGIRSPKCHRVQRVSEEEILLWLEDVPHGDSEWGDKQHIDAAFKLGQFSGYWGPKNGCARMHG